MEGLAETFNSFLGVSLDPPEVANLVQNCDGLWVLQVPKRLASAHILPNSHTPQPVSSISNARRNKAYILEALGRTASCNSRS